MSPEAYSWEIREAAEEMYIIDGLTFEHVAERTAVSISQLKRWGLDAVPSWSERRREYRQAQVSVRRGVMLAKAKLIESVIETEDAQKAYAFASLVSSAKTLNQEARERSGTVQPQIDQALNLGTDQPVDMAEALNQALRMKINSMLAQPGAITLPAIKELQQAMALLDKIKTTVKPTGNQDANQQMTPEELQAEIRKVYGI